MTRAMQYLTSLGILVALFFVYQNTFVRWLEPEPIQPVAIKPLAQQRRDREIEDLFPEGSWQRGACKRLKTAEGVLLFERREQTAPNKWRLWPITVVLGRGRKDHNEEPVILDASQGAEIELTSALNMIGGVTPSIRRGRLIGPVRIYRTPSAQSSSHPLELKTSNVGIDNQKIWTTEAVEIQYGDTTIVGRDLTVHLAGDPSSPNADIESTLDRMELIYLDHFSMPIASTAPDGTKTSSQIRIECGGRVEYDFGIHFLTLRDTVSLIHEAEHGFVDRFDCETLRLGLHDPGNRSLSRKGLLDWVANLSANGNPVVASLPSYNAEIVADEIKLDVLAGTLRAKGEKGIRLRRGSITASLANLDYRFNPQAFEKLGSFKVEGPGIVTIKDSEIVLRKAQWQQRLEIKPLQPTTIQSMESDLDLTVQGDVRAWLIDGGEFQAEEIVGRLQSVPNLNNSRTLVPDAFDVTGNVRIATNAIIAKTDRLKLFFEEGPHPMGNPHPTGAEGDHANSSPFHQWVTQPNNQEDSEGGTTVPVVRPVPEIGGDLIVAKLLRSSAGLSVHGLKVAGNVVVKHTIDAGGRSLATTLTGELLQLINSGGENVLQLGSGIENPARFEIGDGYFIGPEIQIRPSENIIWIKDAGEFRIPTDALPSSLSAGGIPSGNSGNIQWTQPPHCRWQGEMQFDGQVAVLTDGVDIDAAILNGREPWKFRISGDRLEVRLQKSVELRDIQTLQTAKIHSIELLESLDRPVRIEARQWAPDGVMQSRHMLSTKKLVMTPTQNGQAGVLRPLSPADSVPVQNSASSLMGKIVGQGPGWYRAWIPSNEAEDGGIASADSTMIDDATRPLTGVHLTFNESMTANVVKKHLDFTRGVRVGLRPLSHWEQTFDAATMNVIGIGESTLDCDRLRILADPSIAGTTRNSRLLKSQLAWEMQADRGVVFRTRSLRGTLQATAARASYASAKDLFSILGAPNRPAVIRQTRPDGKPGMTASVKSALIRPKTMTIENAEIIGVNIASPKLNPQRR